MKGAPKGKILVVDDSMVDRELCKMVFSQNGFEVIELESFVGCMEVLERERPDLVLLDILMPDVDGNQALREIRKKFSQVELPIIMVTAKSENSEVVGALKDGANDFIAKPVQFEVAIRRVQTQLLFAQQSKMMAQAKELEAIHAMIVTYSHEINNPLAIAEGYLALLQKSHPNETEIVKARAALARITDIIKKTQLVLQQQSVEYQRYTDSAKMLALKKAK